MSHFWLTHFGADKLCSTFVCICVRLTSFCVYALLEMTGCQLIYRKSITVKGVLNKDMYCYTDKEEGRSSTHCSTVLYWRDEHHSFRSYALSYTLVFYRCETGWRSFSYSLNHSVSPVAWKHLHFICFSTHLFWIFIKFQPYNLASPNLPLRHNHISSY